MPSTTKDYAALLIQELAHGAAAPLSVSPGRRARAPSPRQIRSWPRAPSLQPVPSNGNCSARVLLTIFSRFCVE